jgi:iron complex transport system ATP-binding protein
MNIDVQGLSFAYNREQVLAGIDFSCSSGELLAILGPNGAGKTTLLKCLNALHKPNKRTVFLDGQDVRSLRPESIAKDIGYVPQQNKTTTLTVFDAVLLGRKPHLRWRVRDQDKAMVEAILRRLGLEDLALRSLDQLSGGELQKVAIARALVQEPNHLLLDEPISSLDMKNQIELLRLVRRVVDEHQIAAVMSLHDVNAALRFADRVLLLKDGALVALTRPELVQAPLLEYTYEVQVEIHFVNGCPTVIPVQD